MRFHSNRLKAKLSVFTLSAGVFNINKKETRGVTEFGGVGQRGVLPESSNKDIGGQPYFSQKKKREKVLSFSWGEILQTAECVWAAFIFYAQALSLVRTETKWEKIQITHPE